MSIRGTPKSERNLENVQPYFVQRDPGEEVILTMGDRIHWHQSKLTPEQRLTIRSRARAGINAHDLAREYGIHVSTVRAIRDGTGSYSKIGAK